MLPAWPAAWPAKCNRGPRPTPAAAHPHRQQREKETEAPAPKSIQPTKQKQAEMRKTSVTGTDPTKKETPSNRMQPQAERAYRVILVPPS